MATDLKTLRKELYATPFDVRLTSGEFFRQYNYADTISFDDPRVDHALLQARGIIDLYLGKVISSTSEIEVTPFAGAPLKPKADQENEGENQTEIYMYGVQAQSTAYTELWTIEFTSSTAFSVKGSFSGSQGTGSTASDFTSTNGDIVIPSDVWTGTSAEGEKIYVCVYKHHQSIVMLASLLGAYYLYQAIGSSEPGASEISDNMYKMAIDMLKAIAKGDAGLSGVNVEISTKDIMMPYEISVGGHDITNYSTDEYDRYSNYSQYYNGCWWWR